MKENTLVEEAPTIIPPSVGRPHSTFAASSHPTAWTNKISGLGVLVKKFVSKTSTLKKMRVEGYFP